MGSDAKETVRIDGASPPRDEDDDPSKIGHWLLPPAAEVVVIVLRMVIVCDREGSIVTLFCCAQVFVCFLHRRIFLKKLAKLHVPLFTYQA